MKALKILAAALLISTAWTAPARATGLEGLFLGLAGGTLTGAASAAAINGFIIGSTISGFVTSGLGALVIGSGLTLAGLFGSNKAAENSRVNVKSAASLRRHAAGRRCVGGTPSFGEHDSHGAFWYIITHCDEEMAGEYSVVLDNIPVEINGAHRVITDEFIGEESGWLGTSSSKPFFSHWLATFTPDNPVPNWPAEFLAAFPEWTSNHKFAGVTHSVVKFDPVKKEDRPGIAKWNGPFGQLGMPSVAIAGVWGRQYDPRDEDQEIDDVSSWQPTSNAALIWAWNRYRRQGFNRPMSSINWERLAAMADICDLPIVDKNGDAWPNYAAGVMFAEDQTNRSCEDDILAAMDGIVVFDAEGKAWCKPGYWEDPGLTLSKQRDIFAMDCVDVRDGETEVDGVVITYTEPDYGYISQPCAPWINTEFYEEGREPNFLQASIEACFNHNQAVRLGKAKGRREQSAYRLGAAVGLRYIRAMRERIVDLAYDEVWTGPHQIASEVAEDDSGLGANLAMVPVAPDNWTLLEGEEGDRPVADSVDQDNTIPDVSGVVVTVAEVPGSNGSAARLEIAFDQPARIDETVEARFKKDGTTQYRKFTVITEDEFGYSDIVEDVAFYIPETRTRRGGRTSEWVAEPPILVSADTLPPGPLSGVSVTPGAGAASLAFTTPDDTNLKAVTAYRAPSGATLDKTAHFGATYNVTPDRAYTKTFSGVGAWDFYMEPVNGSGVPGPLVGPYGVTIV